MNEELLHIHALIRVVQIAHDEVKSALHGYPYKTLYENHKMYRVIHCLKDALYVLNELQADIKNGGKK